MSNEEYDNDLDEFYGRRFVPRLVTKEFHHPISQPDTIERFLTQTKVWMDREGTEHKIKDLEKEYIFNILSWAQKQHDRLTFTLEFINPSNIDVLQMPLFEKLRARYRKLIA